MGDIVPFHPPLTPNEKALIDEMAEMSAEVDSARQVLVMYRHLLDTAQRVVSEALWSPERGGMSKPLVEPQTPSIGALRALERAVRHAERAYNPFR